MDALVFDDDTFTAEMVAQLLREDGYAAEKFHTGEGAVEIIRRLTPRLVVLDIMMPGLDGLSICKALKKDPSTSGIRVIVASGKPFQSDREEASRCGADHFMAKPYQLARLRETFKEILGMPAAGGGQQAPAQGLGAPARAPVLRGTVWGCRSEGDPSLPTSCLRLDLGGRWVLLDAGTGLAALASAPLPPSKEHWLLLTHQHPDHVSGLAALRGAFDPATSVKIGGPNDTRAPLGPAVAAGLQGPARARLQLFALSEKAFGLWADVAVTALLTRHPGSTLAYRFQVRDRALVYCPDNEPEDPEDVQSDFTDKLRRFVRGADLLIHDARYTDADYPSAMNRGHSCPAAAVRLAEQEGVRSLLLTHMDARYTPEQLDGELARVRADLAGRGSSVSVDLARPGLEFTV